MQPKKIAKIIKDCFDPSPAEKAALLLYYQGVTESEYWSHRKSKELILIPEPWLLSVCNALRDIERKEKEGTL